MYSKNFRDGPLPGKWKLTDLFTNLTHNWTHVFTGDQNFRQFWEISEDQITWHITARSSDRWMSTQAPQPPLASVDSGKVSTIVSHIYFLITQTSSTMFFCNTCNQPLCSVCKEETHKAKMFASHTIVTLNKRTKEQHKKCGKTRRNGKLIAFFYWGDNLLLFQC